MSASQERKARGVNSSLGLHTRESLLFKFRLFSVPGAFKCWDNGTTLLPPWVAVEQNCANGCFLS